MEYADEDGSEGDLAGEHIPRSCKLAHHNKTLAVNNEARNKVRLYNCDSDEMVGQIETRAGPIYNMTMNNRPPDECMDVDVTLEENEDEEPPKSPVPGLSHAVQPSKSKKKVKAVSSTFLSIPSDCCSSHQS